MEQHSIGSLIKQLRKKAGLTQTELAQKIGSSQAMIVQYEQGKRQPKLENIRKIADALGCDIGALLAFKISDTTEIDGINYHTSKEYLDTNRQFFRISYALEFLKSMNFSFIEKIIFKDVQYTRNYIENNLLFTSSLNSEEPLDFTESDLIEIINSSEYIPTHIIEMKYGDSVQEMNYSDYLKWMNNFIESARLIALQQFHNIETPQIYLDDISNAIEQHATEIAQGTWQPPTSDEQHQKLLRAVYGENIPDTPKKEE